MEDVIIRFWQQQDLPDLQEIFSASYGDPPEIIQAFHRLFLHAPENCLLTAVPEAGKPEGRPVAAGYCLSGLTLRFPDRKPVPCSYLYALGCLPSRRGHGYGMALHTRLFAEAGKQGTVRCMIPVSESKLRKYSEIGPVYPLGRMRSTERFRTELSADPMSAEDLTPEAYARRRETLLESFPHAEYSSAWFTLMAAYGDCFLALPGALAAVIPLEDRCLIAELLCTDTDPDRALAGIAARCPAERYEVRTPAFFPGPGEFRRFAYLNCEIQDTPEDFWFPFGLE